MATLGLTPTDMLRAAWTWWRDELASMAPRALSDLLARRSRMLLIECDSDSLCLSHHGGGEVEELGVIPLPRHREASDSHAAALASIIADRPGSYDRLVLRLAPERTLRRRLRMPLAARENLREAVALDLDRQMPLPAEDLYFGVREVAVHRADGQIELQLDAVRRGDAGPALEVMNAAGLAPDRLEAAADGPNLLPQDAYGGKARMRRRVTLALAGLALVCTAMAVWLPSQRIADRLADIRAESAVVRAEAARVAGLRERMAAIASRRSALVARKQATPLALDVIAAATKAIDDDAFLLELTLDDDRLTINGYARTASDVLSAIDSSPMFSDARFVSSVTQDAQLQRDRFTLSARIAGDAATAVPADDGAGS